MKSIKYQNIQCVNSTQGHAMLVTFAWSQQMWAESDIPVCVSSLFLALQYNVAAEAPV